MFLYGFDPHYGLLRCDCGETPIVHAVCVYSDIGQAGEILQAVKDRRGQHALALTIGATARHGEFRSGGIHDPRTRAGMSRLLEFLDNPLMTMHQFLEAVVPPEELEKQFYRPATPAYLSGIALGGLLAGEQGFALHLGCGAGHLERALSIRIPPTRLVGVDGDFCLLYAASRFLSPDSFFVCHDMKTRLPFKNGVFRAAILEPEPFEGTLASEADRVVEEEGVILGTAFDTADSFLSRFPRRPGRGYALRGLAKQFVRERVFDASCQEKPDGRVAVIASRNEAVFQRIPLEDMLGCRVPTANPVYELHEQDDAVVGSLRDGLSGSIIGPELQEAGALPKQVRIQKELLRKIQDGELCPEALDLLSKLAVVDLPPDYA